MTDIPNTKLIPLTQGKHAIVDEEDYEFLMQWKWCCNGTGYASRAIYEGTVNGKQKFRHIIMHRLIINTPDGMETDHKNYNRLDNRKINLRMCTKAQNKQNSHRKNLSKTSKYKGVSFHTRNRVWVAQIQPSKGRKLYIGSFKKETEAALAYNKAAIEYFGEFAFLNEIPHA